MKIRRGWVIRVAIIIVLLLLCGIFFPFVRKINSSGFSLFGVKDLKVSQEVSSNGEPIGITDTFPTDTERIYAFFTLNSKLPMRLTVKWYHENELLLVYEKVFQPGVNYCWIARRDSAEFEEGEYRVKVVDQEVEFKVEKVEPTT